MDRLSVLISALRHRLGEGESPGQEVQTLADAVADLDDEQTDKACSAITSCIATSLAGDETNSTRREGLERWASVLAELHAAAREESNTAFVDYVAQVRTSVLIDHLGWYSEGLSWVASVSDDVSPKVRQILDGDAASAALHLGQSDRARSLLDRAILGAARIRDLSSLARHFDTLAITLARQEDFDGALRSIELALTFDGAADDDDARRLKLRSDQAAIAAAVAEAEDDEE